MTLDEMLALTMRQTGEDEASLPEYRELAIIYLNEGISDISAGDMETGPVLAQGNDQPPLPETCHGALADYATWRLLGLGGRERQIKGDFFRERYMLVKRRYGDRMARKRQA